MSNHEIDDDSDDNTTDYSVMVDHQLERWIEQQLETLDESITNVTQQLETIEHEKGRLTMHLAVWERRRRALQDILVSLRTSASASANHPV